MITKSVIAAKDARHGGGVTLFSIMIAAYASALLCAEISQSSTETKMQTHSYTHRTEIDSMTGWKIYLLSYRDPKDRRKSLEARISPDAGSNLYSLKVDAVELLVQPDSVAQLPGFRYGFPVLYPTPNRVRDSKFTFGGHSYSFSPNDRSHFIHGLVHSLRWQCAAPASDAEGVTLKTWLDWNAAFPGFQIFPVTHRISLTYRLNREGVKISFTVENQDDKLLPFGFALHPWFQILGTRAETFLQVPAQKHMKAEGLLPTGKLENLDNSPYDLRKPVSLQRLNLDDVYWGLSPEQAPGYECRDKGVKVSLAASAEFTHMVVYTPQGKPFFCMENQTCSTDAHNLYAKGLKEEAHLLIAEKGKPVTGWVMVKVEKRPL